MKQIILTEKDKLNIYIQIIERLCVLNNDILDDYFMYVDKASHFNVDRCSNPSSYLYTKSLDFPVSESKTISYVDKCSRISNTDKYDAAKTICKILNVKLDFFSTNGRNYRQFSGPLLRCVPDDTSRFSANKYLNFDLTTFDYIAEIININGCKFQRIDKHSILIHNFRGEVFSIIFFYYCHESQSYFLLNSYMQQLFNSYYKYICIPNLSNNNLFSNIHLINFLEYADSQIIIFEDKYLFSILSECIKNQSLDLYKNFIITCRHADFCKESVRLEDFNIFKYRNVVYVPSFDKNTYINSINLLEILKNCSDQVRVYQYPVVFRCQFNPDGSFTGESYKNRSDAWYREILSNLLIRDDFSIDELLTRICEESVSEKVFKKWMSGLGIISDDSLQQLDHESDDLTVDELIAHAEKNDYSDNITYDRWINPYDTTFIYAGSDVGKGLFVLTISLSLAFKFSSFNFSVDNARKVYLLDGETPKFRMGRRLKQLKTAYNLSNINKKYLNNLEIHCKLDSKSPVDIATEKGRNEFRDKLVQKKIDVLVIDNLNSFYPESVKSSSSWHVFRDWLHTLKNFNISVILVHHALKNQEANYKGPAEIGSLSQNVINLRMYEAAKNSNYSSGALILFNFIKCKEMPQLKNKEFLFYLEEVGDINLAKPWIDLTSADIVSSDSKILYESFSEKFRHIYDKLTGREKLLIDQFLLNNELKRKDVESITKLKQTAAGELLRYFLDNKFILSVGDGKNIKYKINPIIFNN